MNSAQLWHWKSVTPYYLAPMCTKIGTDYLYIPTRTAKKNCNKILHYYVDDNVQISILCLMKKYIQFRAIGRQTRTCSSRFADTCCTIMHLLHQLQSCEITSTAPLFRSRNLYTYNIIPIYDIITIGQRVVNCRRSSLHETCDLSYIHIISAQQTRI